MTDLDLLLRETLSARAATISAGPAWEPASADAATEVLDLIPEPAPRQRRGPSPAVALLAAAVAVAAVIGVIVSVHHGRRATGGAISTGPSPTVSTVTRASCRTDLPATWQAAARRSTTTVGDGGALQSLLFWGMTSDGSAVVEYDVLGDRQPSSISERVGLIAPGTSQIHEFARVTTHTRSLALEVDVDQDLVVIRVDEGVNRTSRWTRILAFDAHTGVTRTVADVPRAAREQLTGPAYALDGRVYWETKTGKGARSERIRALTMDTGAETLVARGVFDLEKSAAGVSWSLTPWRLDRPADLPAAVRAHVNDLTFDSFVTDGSAYAWQGTDGAIDWWRPAAGHVIRVPRMLARPFSTGEPGSVFAVAGPIVDYQPAHSSVQRVLDVRTGATAPISDQTQVQGRLGELVGNSIDPASAGSELLRLPTSGMPALRC